MNGTVLLDKNPTKEIQSLLLSLCLGGLLTYCKRKLIWSNVNNSYYLHLCLFLGALRPRSQAVLGHHGGRLQMRCLEQPPALGEITLGGVREVGKYLESWF